MKIKTRLAIMLLIFFISFSPISLSTLPDYSQASNYEEITEDQEWATDKTIDRDVFVGSAATLTIKKGVTITFNNKNIHVYGKMIVSGTMKNPVIFKKAEGSQNYSISIWQGGNLIMRNADVSGGGGFYPWVLQNNSIINTSYAVAYGSYQGAVHAGGGTLSVQGSNFHDNDVAMYVDAGSAGKVITNRSKFSNNSQLDIAYASNNEAYKVDGRYNWWGSAGGPSRICSEGDECYFDKIKGAVDTTDWLTSENFHDPVVIIPGIFGSQEEDGIWKIDPIFHVYDNLIDEFIENGYVSGKDLFVFPYEWRDSNVKNAIKLRYKIAEIKAIANWPKVDIVAHSMGGLLAREYIQSNVYQKDIDQLITLGTPNNGSPEIYPLWEAGKAIGAVQSGMKKFLNQEMEEAGYWDMFDYIRNRPVSSAQELLPNYEYLYDVDSKQSLIYPSGYPFNVFLDNLNNEINVKKLVNVEYTKIAGNVGSNISTISGFNVIKVDMGTIWEHGYPLSFEIPIVGDRGTTNGVGDGTVPLSSAKSVDIWSDSYLELNSSHTDLPTKAQKDVLETLTGNRPTSEVTDSLIKNMLQVLVHSPVDIQIVSPSGKKYGKDFENNTNFESIGGSYYTGYDTENEFITIPDPEDGEYRILTKGTGDGEYRIETTKVSEDPADSSKVLESAVTMRGIAVIDESEELSVEVKGDVVIDKNTEIVSPPPPPIIPPATIPAAPPVTPIINQTQATTNVATVVAKKKSHKKKTKSHKKKVKKTKISKAPVRITKVLGVSVNKNVKQKNPIAKSWSYVIKKSTTVWQNTTKAAKTLKDIIFKPLKYFKR